MTTETEPRRLSRGDLLIDAARTIRSRPGRALALGVAVALGVATFVGIVAISESANLRTQERIDKLRPELIRLTSAQTSELTPAGADGMTLKALTQSPRVRAAGIADTYQQQPVTARIGGAPVDATVVGVDGDLLGATKSRYTGEAMPEAGLLPASHVAMVGAGVASRLGLADSTASPVIWVDGVPFTVIGVVDDSTYLADLVDSVLIPRSTAAALVPGAFQSSTAYVRTDRGAASSVADELPLRLTPNAPEQWFVDVPRVPIDVTEGISEDLRRLTFAMSGLVMAIGVIAIANAMMRSVFERTSEIGLRRALGARARHIVGMVVLEAMIIGAGAGVGGVILGSIVATGVSVRNGWPVQVDPQSVVAAVLAASFAGIVAGLIPGTRAVRITPSQALRRD